MPARFNPYTSWLRIPIEQQPPDHYRILGLKRFEADIAKIESSVEKRVAFLQDVSNGPQVAEAQKLLSEVARARLCLRNEQRKQKYDQKLSGHLAAHNMVIDLPEITELPDPDEWLFKGAMPEARTVQNVKVKKRSIPDPLAAPVRAAATQVPEKSKLFWPIIATANLALLAIAGAGIYWILTNGSDIAGNNSASDLTTSKVASQARSQAAKSTAPVSEDFEGEAYASDPKDFESPIGMWALPENCQFSNQDEGQRHLHLTGTSPVTIKLAETIAFPAICEMQLEKLHKPDSIDPNALLEFAISADGVNWDVIEADFKSQNVAMRRGRGPVPSKVIFVVREPNTSSVRIKYVGKGAPESGLEAGILMGSLDLIPVTNKADLEEPVF